MTPEVTEQFDYVLDHITLIPTSIEANTANSKVLHAPVLTFRGNRQQLVKSEPLLKNHLRPFTNNLTEETKLQHFQS